MHIYYLEAHVATKNSIEICTMWQNCIRSGFDKLMCILLCESPPSQLCTGFLRTSDILSKQTCNVGNTLSITWA